MSKKILIGTIGGVIEPIINSIQQIKPDRLVLLGGEQNIIVRNGIEVSKFPINEYLPQALERINFNNSYEFQFIEAGENISAWYTAASATIAKIKQENPNSNIYADYTGGNKNQSVGLALAALEHGIILQSQDISSQQRVTHNYLPALENIRKISKQQSLSSSITAFRIGNFKAFADSQYIPIRPLTLIYGANSSGKSSIIHSLLLAHHAIKNKGELDVYRTEAGGDSVDLGGFGQYVHKRDRTAQVQWAVDIDPKQLNLGDDLTDLLQNVKQLTVGVGIGTRASGQGRVRVRSFYLEADGQEVLSMSSRPKGNLQLDNLDIYHPIIRNLVDAIVETKTYSLEITPEEQSAIEQAVNELVPKLTAKASRFFPKKFELEDEYKSVFKLTSALTQRTTRESPTETVRLFFRYSISQLINAVTDAIEENMGRLRYLAPFRTYPPRHYAFSHQQDADWYSGGGYAWDILLKDAEVRQKVNAWLGDTNRMKSPYELVVRNLLADSQLANELYPLVSNSFEKLVGNLISSFYTGSLHEDYDKLEQIVLSNSDTDIQELISQISELDTLAETWVKEIASRGDRISDLVLIDKRTKTPVSHRDVGIGVSQVIPILVSCYGLSDALVAIEQPELHLHPKLQAELGDVFIESALGQQKNTFILETHSEHLLLRIMRRMRETFNEELPEGFTPVKPEDVSIIFVDPDTKGSLVMEMPLNKKGELKKSWPGGFFEEGLEEVFA